MIVAGWSDGSRERLSHVLAEHGLKSLELVSSWPQAKTARPGALPLAVIALEQGFEAPELAVIGEQDILGDRLMRQSKRKRRAQDVLAEAAALTAGDLVVHIDHGVGRFVGLKTIEAAGAPHDCLEIHYAGGDRLFLPVENLELLSRYGSETGELDKLGGAGWQSRKARLKKRVREMAGELIRVAAQRMTRPRRASPPPTASTTNSAPAFPTTRRRTRKSAIEATLDDLAAGPADGPADLRRRRLRQDGGGAARRLRRGDQRQADRDRRADDAARPPACQNLPRAVRRACRSRSASCRAWSAPPSSARRRRASPRAGSTSSSARMRCSARP